MKVSRKLLYEIELEPEEYTIIQEGLRAMAGKMFTPLCGSTLVNEMRKQMMGANSHCPSR